MSLNVNIPANYTIPVTEPQVALWFNDTINTLWYMNLNSINSYVLGGATTTYTIASNSPMFNQNINGMLGIPGVNYIYVTNGPNIYAFDILNSTTSNAIFTTAYTYTSGNLYDLTDYSSINPNTILVVSSNGTNSNNLLLLNVSNPTTFVLDNPYSFTTTNNSPRGISFDGNYIWITDSNQFYQYQPNLPLTAIGTPVATGFTSNDISSDGNYVWVSTNTNNTTGAIYYDANNLSSSHQIQLGITNTSPITVKKNKLWVGNNNNIYEYTVTPVPVPCIPKGQKVLTPSGYKLIETFQDGDLILTPDDRQVPVKVYTTIVKKAVHKNAPYLIPANIFSTNVPLKDIILSPAHAIQLNENLWQIPKKAAKNNQEIKQIDLGKEIKYFHLETPDYLHDNIILEGSVVESYGVNYIKEHFRGSKVYHYDHQSKAYHRILTLDSDKISSTNCQ